MMRVLTAAGAGEMVKKVKFVVGIEDRVSMRWQLAILLESLRGKLPDGWEPWVGVCNDGRPLSADLQPLLNAYGTRHFVGADHPHRENMDFAAGEDVYVPINRIEALNVVADHVGDDDLVCLTETDVFLYKDLNPRVFPQGNALFDNWIVRQDVFFTHGGAHEKTGVRLPMLLEAMGCTTPCIDILCNAGTNNCNALPPIAVTPITNAEQFVYVGTQTGFVMVDELGSLVGPVTTTCGPNPCAPLGIAVSADGVTVFVSLFEINQVLGINVTGPMNTVTNIATVGNNPLGLAVTPNGDTVYVANMNGQSVSAFTSRPVGRGAP